MKLDRLSSSQYKLLSKYAEDLSKAIALYNGAGFLLPSILPSVRKPTTSEFLIGLLVSLTLLILAVILIKKGEK